MQRRTRIHCQIPCELFQGSTRAKASVVDLSEGGLGLVTRLVVAEGDDIRIELFPGRKASRVVVHGIVWSLKRRTDARGRPANPLVGVMISNPPRPYSALVARLSSRESTRTPVVSEARARAPRSARAERPRASEAVSIVVELEADGSLPRPKFPLPPPKQSDEEALPLFAARVKQRSGTRTRRVKLRCTSVHDVERRVREDLGEDWEILEVTSVAESPVA